MTTPSLRAISGGIVAAIALLLSVSAAADAAKRPSGCGGVALPKDTGGTWRCTFDDDFNGRVLDTSKWVGQQTATSGYTSGPTACFMDRRENISVANGVLSLTAREEPAPFTCSDPFGDFTTRYTSGMVSTWGRFAQAYGRFEIRARVPATSIKGLQSALWMWPEDASRYGEWPASGEIDIAEMYSQYPDRAVPYIHYNPSGIDPNVTNTECLINDIGSFHTYAAEWTPSTIKITYDGTTCLVNSWDPALPLIKPQPFDQPFIVVLTQALGIGANEFDPATTPLPATTQIDYVRVWA